MKLYRMSDGKLYPFWHKQNAYALWISPSPEDDDVLPERITEADIYRRTEGEGKLYRLTMPTGKDDRALIEFLWNCTRFCVVTCEGTPEQLYEAVLVFHGVGAHATAWILKPGDAVRIDRGEVNETANRMIPSSDEVSEVAMILYNCPTEKKVKQMPLSQWNEQRTVPHSKQVPSKFEKL